MATNNVNRRAGVLTGSIAGNVFDIVETKYSLSSVKRETLVGQSGVTGYKEMPVPGSITLTIRDAKGYSAKQFEAMTTVDIALLLANGKSVVAQNAWCTEAIEVDTLEATFEVKFETTNIVEGHG